MKVIQRLIFLPLLCITFNSNAQYLTGLNNKMISEIANTMADAYLLKHIKNISQIIDYNEQFYFRNQHRLIFDVDIALPIIEDSSIYLIKGHISNTNYNILFAFNLHNLDFFVLNHGYECCEKLKFQNLRKLIYTIKNSVLINYENEEHLILDVLSPSYYSYYKISNDTLIHFSRFLSNVGDKNDLFANRINSMHNDRDKNMEYLICDSSYERFYHIGINKAKIKFSGSIDKENIFGNSDYFDGPKIIFCW